jgi:hypothetical protein
MKILPIVAGIILLLLLGAFGFFAFTDVPIPQQDVSREVPQERFNVK